MAPPDTLYIMYVSIVHLSDCCFIVSCLFRVYSPPLSPFIYFAIPICCDVSNLLDSLTDACETPCLTLAMGAAIYNLEAISLSFKIFKQFGYFLS